LLDPPYYLLMTTSRHSPVSLPACASGLLALVVLCSGCGGPETVFRFNAVYLKKQEATARSELTPQQKQDIVDVLVALFGTPDDPHVPPLPDQEFDRLLPIDKLRIAAGPIGSDQQGRNRGVYRANCAPCHGTTGDGAGPTAVLLEPYPRDFRSGGFKFKSTPSKTPPTDEDLLRDLQNGMPGSAMPSFRLLNEEDLDALVPYVKYLSIRGEVERALIFESVDRLDRTERLVPWNLSLPDIEPAALLEQVAGLQPILVDVAQRWLNAPQQITEVPHPPTNWDLAASVVKGRELFLGNVANCVKCHGETARGDGQTNDYDDWTKEYLDPQNPTSADPYVALGALPPVHIRPRNLRRGVFRGGHRPADLYLRIHNGIAGTPMPAASMKPAGAGPEDQRLSPEDLWHLMDYVRQLSEESASQLAQGQTPKRDLP
jgi:mono/diheme cytochrome c family protein